VVVVIPNETGGETSHGPTLCWQHFAAPDSAGEMRGTFFEYHPGRHVMPVHASSPWQKQMQKWQQAKFLRRALSLAMFHEQLLTCRRKVVNCDASMYHALRDMVGRPLAVDIETMTTGDLITAVGVSDGVTAVSLPYHSFTPHGRDAREPGWQDYEWGAKCRAVLSELLAANTPKFLHNHTFDVPRLAAESLPLGGEIHDTFAAHAIAFPELRHGLQHACADMLPIRPWKSQWHPKVKGLTRDDEEYWICDPDALRDYNCDDAYHTFHLARSILPCVGVNLGL
jgi:hypothetical protein